MVRVSVDVDVEDVVSPAAALQWTKISFEGSQVSGPSRR
jgi:hypothetical protein